MADIVVDASVSTSAYVFSAVGRAGPFYVSTTVGYIIGVDSDGTLGYWKTADGGATWGAHTEIDAGNILAFDCWPDWQTVGDAGTKIHIAFNDDTNDEVDYIYLDTNGDSVGGKDTIKAAGAAFSGGPGSDYQYVSICKARGGNICVAYRYKLAAGVTEGFATSPDGDTWTDEAIPWEGSYPDLLLLFAGNEADNQDIWAAYMDDGASELSLKTYDDSGNSWSEQSIDASVVQNEYYRNFDGQLRLSDGHLILPYHNNHDNAANDLRCVDINGAGSITQKTDLITNEAENVKCSVFINQVNDDIYVAYLAGGSWSSEVTCVYQKSSNGGTAWGGETAYQADAVDDHKWLSAGCMKAAWGGFFQPVFWDDDDKDLFVNVDNDVAIAAAGGPTDYPISSIVYIGVLPSATRVAAIDRDSAIIVGVLATATRVYAAIRAASVIVGVLVSASRLAAFIRSSSIIVGELVTASRALGADRDSSVSVGVLASASRALAAIRSSSVIVGVLVSASKVTGWVKSSSVIIGVLVSATRAVDLVRSSSVAIGVLATASRLGAFIRATSTIIGVKVSTTATWWSSGAVHYIRSTSVAIGVAVSVTYCTVMKELLRIAQGRLDSVRLAISSVPLFRRVRRCE